MSVCFAIPVAPTDIDRAGKTFAACRDMGYETAALIYSDRVPDNCDRILHVPEYKGWAWAVNRLCEFMPGAEWIISGGSDITCDPHKRADVIAAECVERFSGSYGVMQPTGDAYGALADKAAAVSPWIGRAFRENVYGGRGPMWEAYGHYWADGELSAIAEMLGVMWWRDDLVQYHDHYTRRSESVPVHLQPWTDGIGAARQLFFDRKAAGFPGH